MKALFVGLSCLALSAGAAAGEVETYFPAAKWAKRAEVSSLGGLALYSIKFELFTSRAGAFPGKAEQNWVALTQDPLIPALGPDGKALPTKTFKYAAVKAADADKLVRKLSLVDWRAKEVYDRLFLCDVPATVFTFFGNQQTVADVCGGAGTLKKAGREMLDARQLYYQLYSAADAAGKARPAGKHP